MVVEPFLYLFLIFLMHCGYAPLIVLTRKRVLCGCRSLQRLAFKEAGLPPSQVQLQFFGFYTGYREYIDIGDAACPIVEMKHLILVDPGAIIKPAKVAGICPVLAQLKKACRVQ